MAELKTQKTKASVTAFLAGIADPVQRKEARALAALMRRATGKAPAMWGTAIVGYGDMTYSGSTGKTVDWFPVGFAPRKSALTVYLMGGLTPHAALLRRLGRHKVSGSCLHLPRLADVDERVLLQLVARSFRLNTQPAPRARKPTTRRTSRKR